MYKYYLYLETTILTLIVILIELIATPFLFIFSSIKTAHNTAEFYSDNKLHFWQGRKAKEIYDKQKEEHIKELKRRFQSDRTN